MANYGTSTMIDLLDLQKNTIFINNKYSGKNGDWGFWLTNDKDVLEFLGDENFIQDENIEQQIRSYEKYWRSINLLKLRHKKYLCKQKKQK